MFKISKFFVTLFGIGYFPFMPGTVGSFFSLIFLMSIKTYSFSFLLVIFICMFVLSIFLIKIYSDNSNKHDSSEIIIDEFLGIFFIVLFYDYIYIGNDFIMFILIFILFRFFDIFKPFPISYIDKKILNSFGIILDDIVAAGFCLITLGIINAIK